MRLPRRRQTQRPQRTKRRRRIPKTKSAYRQSSVWQLSKQIVMALGRAQPTLSRPPRPTRSLLRNKFRRQQTTRPRSTSRNRPRRFRSMATSRPRSSPRSQRHSPRNKTPSTSAAPIPGKKLPKFPVRRTAQPWPPSAASIAVPAHSLPAARDKQATAPICPRSTLPVSSAASPKPLKPRKIAAARSACDSARRSSAPCGSSST